VLVNCKLGGVSPGAGIWCLTLPELPSGDGWNGVTLMPSIRNGHHGRKKRCGYHCSIVNGDVLP
jgi:hypothetical protein